MVTIHDSCTSNVFLVHDLHCERTWCFRASYFTLFHIDPSRGSQVLKAILTETFDGIIGANHFSAYHKYMSDCGALLQFCWVHFTRDIGINYLCLLVEPMPISSFVPSILVETTVEYSFLFRIQVGDIFFKLCHNRNRHRT